MFFQSFELLQERSGRIQARQIALNQSKAIDVLTAKERDDQRFFDLVGALITLGPSQTPEAIAERQAILKQLNDLRLEHEKAAQATTTTTTPKTKNGTTTTTTTTASSSRSPPPSTSTSTTSTTRTTLLGPLPTIPNVTIPPSFFVVTPFDQFLSLHSGVAMGWSNSIKAVCHGKSANSGLRWLW
jgi:hypothetical protein